LNQLDIGDLAVTAHCGLDPLDDVVVLSKIRFGPRGRQGRLAAHAPAIVLTAPSKQPRKMDTPRAKKKM
jgi:hypothetical protein